jgi:hypothetical protein
MFTPSPSTSSDAATTTTTEPELHHFTRSRTAPESLDPSTHTITYYHDATKYDGSNDVIKNYCNILEIKQPSTTRGRMTSQGGCIKIFYTSEKQNLPKVKRNQLNAYFAFLRVLTGHACLMFVIRV